jgi:hypothetical protein
MSFALTTNQIINKTKTVTRRNGWWFLRPGDVVNAVEKAMGLKKGETVRRICQIQILSTRREQLNQIAPEDVAKEGFPQWTSADFIEMYCAHNHCEDTATVNRIEFRYIPKQATLPWQAA